MSLLAILTNIYLRHHFKPRAGAALLVPAVRARVGAMLKRQPPVPADIRCTPVPAAGRLCAAEWFETSGAQVTVLYLHGGGYFFGNIETHRPVCACLSRVARARVLSLDDRLAPEHFFPAAVDDALDWYRQLLTQVPASRLVIAGDSAGGGLALACLLAARAEGLPMPAASVLFSPWVDLACSGDTLRTLARADVMLTPDSMRQAAALYLNGRAPADPLASPLNADLCGLPPMLICASRHEILLSDATRLHARAQGAGVHSTLSLRSRLPHAWPTMVMLAEARVTLREAAAFIGTACGSLLPES